ncbi:MAG: ribosomal RNA small subunit methyltransferase A [Chloroflexaceae bacterium]|nr:ribosomal RNA small subunit methyltransferase A [Chloroflexaceae bacterium]
MNPYLNPQRVRAALRSLELRPTRGMGQNFLTDGGVLRQIVEAAELSATDTIVEVGPGLGVLTWELLQHTPQVAAVELDRRLAARLPEAFPTTTPNAPHPALHIIQSDILRVPAGDIVRQARAAWGQATTPPATDAALRHTYKVVANLPYAITAPVLQHFLESVAAPRQMIVLVQWEVAQRITAQPGDMSLRAYSVQMYAHPTIVARVPAASFLPPPDVDSAILRLDVYDRPAVDVDSIAGLFRVIRAGFLQPRKKISNGLPKGLTAQGLTVPAAAARTALHQAGVNGDRRPETLALEEWAAVYRALQEAQAFA